MALKVPTVIFTGSLAADMAVDLPITTGHSVARITNVATSGIQLFARTDGQTATTSSTPVGPGEIIELRITAPAGIRPVVSLISAGTRTYRIELRNGFSTTVRQTRILRRPAGDWNTENPVLADGQVGFDETSFEFRVGDGSTAWSALLPIGGAPSGGLTVEQVQDIVGAAIEPGDNTTVDYNDSTGTVTVDAPAAQLLTALKTTDGSGSGLDADLVHGRTLTVERSVTEYGTVGSGDDTAIFQAALNDLHTTAAAIGTLNTAVLKVPVGNYHLSGVTVPGQVAIDCDGARFTANATGPMFTFTGSYSSITRAMLNGNGVGQGASGVVFANGARWNILDTCRFDQMSGRAVLMASGSISNWARRLFAQNCLLTTGSLATHTGVVEIAGSDNFFETSEITSSRLTLSSVNGYAAALVVSGANPFISDIQAEISDIGVVLASGASDVHLVDVRADLNRAHGFLIRAGHGTLTGCYALNNSQETDGAYDGFRFDATGGSNYQLDNCTAMSSTVSRHQFGFYDQQNSFSNANVFGSTCRSFGSVGAPIAQTAFAGGRVCVTEGPVYSITVNATTWNVQTPGWPYRAFYFQADTATTFTQFTGGVGGHMIVVFGDGSTTIQNNANTVTLTGSNLLTVSNRPYQFINRNGVWYQI